jgi:hypothetical protein
MYFVLSGELEVICDGDRLGFLGQGLVYLIYLLYAFPGFRWSLSRRKFSIHLYMYWDCLYYFEVGLHVFERCR